MPSAGSIPWGGLVVPTLPVERGFERVLHRQGAPFDEEQMRQRRVAQDTGEGLDEAGHRHRVHVGIAGLVQRGLHEFGMELPVVHQRRGIHTQCRGGNECEHVQVAPTRYSVDQI